MKSHNWSLKRKKQQAFSLLEILIASTIFSVVLLVASSSFKFFMSMGSRQINSEGVMQESMNMIKIRSAIKGIQSYYIRKSAISLQDSVLFFQGKSDGFTAMTISSIDFPAQPARISVAKKQENANQWNLVYCEYDNRIEFPLTSLDINCDDPKIIASNIESVDFSYFGWSSLDTLYSLSGTSQIVQFTNKKVWATPWDAAQRGIIPQYIKISVTYMAGVKPYQPSQLWFHLSDADPVQISTNNTLDE